MPPANGSPPLRVRRVAYGAPEAARLFGANDLFQEWFAGPDWLEPWHEVFGRERDGHLRAVYAGEHPVGYLPVVRAKPRHGLCQPTWELAVNRHVRRMPIPHAVPLAQLLEAVLRDARERGELGCFEFRHLERGAAAERGLCDAAGALGANWLQLAPDRSAVVTFENGWDGYVATRNGRLVRDVRRRLRRLREAGPHWEEVRETAAFDAAWRGVLEVERASWKHEAGTSIPRDPGADRFYRSVAARAAARGALRLTLLHVESAPVAFTLGVVEQRTHYLLKNSFRDDAKALAPGLLSVWRAMEGAAAEGCERFDFLGSLTDFKARFATSTPEYVTFKVFPRTNLRCQLEALTERDLKPLGRRLGLHRLARRLRRLRA